MVIIDISSIAYLVLYQLKDDITADLMRHALINKLWNIVSYLDSEDFDVTEIIIACDSKNNWRRDVHPNYKGSRKNNRKKQSKIDWQKFFENFNLILDEFSKNMPFKTIRVNKAEADDIIAVICRNNKDKEIVIVSPDKDFRQLCNDKTILYSPVSSVGFIDASDYCLFEHIIKGDSEDDIPNILSDINVFTDGIRQTVLSAKKKQQLIDYRFNLENSPIMTDDILKRIYTNTVLIDFDHIPKYIIDDVNKEYNEFEIPKGKIFNYFVKNKLVKLMEMGAFR